MDNARTSSEENYRPIINDYCYIIDKNGQPAFVLVIATPEQSARGWWVAPIDCNGFRLHAIEFPIHSQFLRHPR